MSSMRNRTLRIASYNIRKAWGLDQRRDPARSIAVINALEADIVVLQECDRRLGCRPAALPRKLIEDESDFAVAEVARNDVSLGWHGNAVLVRKGYAALNVSHIHLPVLEPRGAVRVEIGGPVSLSVVGVHLGLRRRDRVRQLRAIAAACGSTGPTIVAGDYNAWSERLGCDVFEERFEVLSPGRSFHASRPIAALDRVAVSEGVRVTDAGVHDCPVARRSSDHLPIWADVSLAPLQ